MNLSSELELINTQKKLRRLEEKFHAISNTPDGDVELHEMTKRSLRRLINQLKEEIARYVAGVSSQRGAQQQ